MAGLGHCALAFSTLHSHGEDTVDLLGRGVFPLVTVSRDHPLEVRGPLYLGPRDVSGCRSGSSGLERFDEDSKSVTSSRARKQCGFAG